MLQAHHTSITAARHLLKLHPTKMMSSQQKPEKMRQHRRPLKKGTEKEKTKTTYPQCAIILKAK